MLDVISYMIATGQREALPIKSARPPVGHYNLQSYFKHPYHPHSLRDFYERFKNVKKFQSSKLN